MTIISGFGKERVRYMLTLFYININLDVRSKNLYKKRGRSKF